MSLHIAAKHLASRGRDGDTELVHMSKNEVRSLQGLALAAGGSLSINPDTGLVEASFLKRILPMVAGAGLMMTGLGPLAAAGLVGGFETLRTGDLGRGLMAGMGAYGGAGLAQGLSSAGAQAANEATREAAITTANATGTNMSAIGEGARNTGADILRTKAGAGIQGSMTSMPGATNVLSNFAGAPAPVTLQNMGAGLGQLTAAGGPTAIYNALPTGTLPAAGLTLADAIAPTPATIAPPMPQDDERYRGAPYNFRLSPNFQGFTPTQPNPYYRPTGLGYAEGGDVMLAQGGSYDDEPMGDTPGMADGGLPGMRMGQGIARDTDEDTASLDAYSAAKKRLEKLGKATNVKMASMPKTNVAGLGSINLAGGGLGSYSDGGRMLKGPGDGMSDDIPATIGGKQPARLADGEFVVPADVVSHLGNGSTDAGARKLYKMMDKVRMARTGKKKQAPAVKTDKYLPRG